jgi:hypothetical protein
MSDSDPPSVTPQRADGPYAGLELQLLNAISDFGTEELGQLLDVVEAIRRLRRV